MSRATDRDRLHAGEVVRLGHMLAKRCSCCGVARGLAEYPWLLASVCNYCRIRNR